MEEARLRNTVSMTPFIQSCQTDNPELYGCFRYVWCTGKWWDEKQGNDCLEREAGAYSGRWDKRRERVAKRSTRLLTCWPNFLFIYCHGWQLQGVFTLCKMYMLPLFYKYIIGHSKTHLKNPRVTMLCIKCTHTYICVVYTTHMEPYWLQGGKIMII